jgi:MFS family permease
VSGILISRYGRWKAYLVTGSVLVAAGFGLLSTIDHTTNMVLLGVFLAVLGLGIGMTMQNLVLAVQNTVAATDLGAASSAVAFFRSLGGTIGVSVLGAVLSARVTTLITDGLPAGAAAQAGGGDVGLATLNDAPPAIQDLIRVSYGDATGRIFLIAALLSVITVLAVVFIHEVALRTESGDERVAQQSAPTDSTSAVDQQLAGRHTAGGVDGPAEPVRVTAIVGSELDDHHGRHESAGRERVDTRS